MSELSIFGLNYPTVPKPDAFFDGGDLDDQARKDLKVYTTQLFGYIRTNIFCTRLKDPTLIVGRPTPCWRCEKPFRAVGVAFSGMSWPSTTYEEITALHPPLLPFMGLAYQVEEYRWDGMHENYAHIVSMIRDTGCHDPIATLKLSHMPTAGHNYFANICPHCAAKQGDYFLMTGPNASLLPRQYSVTQTMEKTSCGLLLHAPEGFCIKGGVMLVSDLYVDAAKHAPATNRRVVS